MRQKTEYVLKLPYSIEGNCFYFFAEDREAALETIFEMLHKVQDICEHTDFTNGKCTDCGLECGHDEVEDDYCLQCGEYQEPMTRQDYLADQAYQAHKERDL